MTVFLAVLAAYLVTASVVLYRDPSHGWGFPLFVLVYLVFLIGWFFVSAGELAATWLGLSIANMLVQFVSIKRQTIPVNPTATLVASLFLWPIQFAATIHNLSSDRITAASKAKGRERIGELPATIIGTVSFTHHIDVDKGYDMVWLAEYGELEFFIEAGRFDQLRIAEERRFTLTVDEREAPKDVSEGRVLWIVDGQAG